MGLAGKLEELALGEILQIICLSRKTGTLFIAGPDGKGSISFCNGQVVASSIEGRTLSLADLLISRRVVDQGTIDAAQATRERLDLVLTARFGLQRERLEETVRAEIMETVFSLFSWREGDFRFEVGEPGIVGSDSSTPLFRQGIDARSLALEGSRRAGNSGVATLGPGRDHPVQRPDLLEGGPAAGLLLVVVDDHLACLKAICAAIPSLGCTVRAAHGVREGIACIEELTREGIRLALLVDLIMPKSDGSGMLGGFELLDHLQGDRKMPVLAMSDYRHEESERRLEGLGIPFILKPRCMEITESTAMERFIASLRRHLMQLKTG